MEIITKQFAKPITPIPPSPEMVKQEDKYGYTPEQREAIAKWRAIPAFRQSVLVHDVIAVINARHNFNLFLAGEIKDGVLTLQDKKRNTYYLIGSWHDSRYICNGLVKRRRGVKRATYLINGQANTGTIQIEHYGEQLQIQWPEIKEIFALIPFLKS
jgi:hypothetical protein